MTVVTTEVKHACKGTAGEGLALGDICYLKNDGKWWKTDANSIATTNGQLGLAMEAISAENSGILLCRGFFKNESWSWTIGGALYVSTTLGAMTQTMPANTGDQVRKVGWAYTANKVWFGADSIIAEVA